MTRHLDIGCGHKPRNPYRQDEVFGLDIGAEGQVSGATVVRANVALQPIPFPDDHFDSVSAYDFLEHVPRVLPHPDGQRLRFPFIELMDEVWRVMRPGGLFYASTPAVPHAAAFQDPTHVNFITRDTHMYFTRPQLMARMYGFHGDFEIVRVLSVRPEFDYEPVNPGWRRRWRLRRRQARGACSHLVWEFKACKPVSSR